MNCNNCDKLLPRNGDFVKCSKCSSQLHFDCSGILSKTWKAKSATKKAEWICTVCRKSRKNSHDSSSSDVSCSEESALDSIKRELTNLNNLFTNLQSSVSSIDKKLEEAMGKVDTLIQENKNLKTENSALKSRVSDLEQYSRGNNLIISNIPQAAGENTVEVVQRVAKLAGVSIDERDIDACHRLPKSPKQAHPTIVVRFCRRLVKQNLLKNKRNPNLINGNLGFTQVVPNGKIYLDEHLTSEKAKLFSAAKMLKNNGYKYVWCKEGKILVRKADGDKVVLIRTEEDIARLINNPNVCASANVL